MEEKDFRNIIMMIQNKLDNLFICINDKQVVLDIDAAKLFGVGIDTVNKAINNNLERFPSDFLIALTDSEKQEVVTKCDHLQNLKYSRNSPHAFTEAGIFMLATLIDSNEARNVAFKIIETFTEHQQLLRHIMVAEYKDEYGKKKEEAYMEDKLKHILARSSACI